MVNIEGTDLAEALKRNFPGLKKNWNPKWRPNISFEEIFKKLVTCYPWFWNRYGGIFFFETFIYRTIVSLPPYEVWLEVWFDDPGREITGTKSLSTINYVSSGDLIVIYRRK